jgi:hypothetical protein
MTQGSIRQETCHEGLRNIGLDIENGAQRLKDVSNNSVLGYRFTDPRDITYPNIVNSIWRG